MKQFTTQETTVYPKLPLRKETIEAVAHRTLYRFVAPKETVDSLKIAKHGKGWKISAEFPSRHGPHPIPWRAMLETIFAAWYYELA
jgi:hypothetical protein